MSTLNVPLYTKHRRFISRQILEIILQLTLWDFSLMKIFQHEPSISDPYESIIAGGGGWGRSTALPPAPGWPQNISAVMNIADEWWMIPAKASSREIPGHPCDPGCAAPGNTEVQLGLMLNTIISPWDAECHCAKLLCNAYVLFKAASAAYIFGIRKDLISPTKAQEKWTIQCAQWA